MASVKLDVYIHRKGTPANVTIRILNSRGSAYARAFASNGQATVDVPENEMYQIYIDPYNKKVKDMPPQRGRRDFTIDLDEYRIR